MFARLLSIILPVFLVVALGYAFARRARPDMTWVNRLNLNVLSPALIFSALAGKDFDLFAHGPLIAGCVAVVLGSGLLAWPFSRVVSENPRTFVPPMMFNNCGNMGLPLAALAFGPAGLSAMVAVFTVSNLLHFTLGVWIIDHRARFGGVVRNPMVIATFVGFAFAATHPPIPDVLMVAIKMVGDAMIPLMLISLGVRLADVPWSSWRVGVLGGVVRPLLGMAVASLAVFALPLDDTQRGLLLLFGCLPPAVLNFMVAEQFGQEPGKVASIVLIGNTLAVAFVPLGLALALP
jgi:predicted permease